MHLSIGGSGGRAGAELLSAPSPVPAIALAGRRQRIVAGLCAVTAVAALHAAHALSHRYGAGASGFSGAMIILQCLALSFAQARAARWGAPLWVRWSGALLLSLVCGVLIVLPLARGWHLTRTDGGAAVAGAAVGAAVTCLWLLLFRLPAALERARVRALEVDALRREAERARLRVHLHPHFLLNTLNAIAGLVTEDPAEARRLLATLGDLVRDAVEGGDELQPFGAEAAWLRRYAEILEARYRGVLAFRWELAEETLAACTPRLLLQPLVENAVQHGALRRRGGGAVHVRSELLTGGTVRFTVEDDGPGFAPGRAEGLGIGLVRRRLALLCPGASLRYERVDVGTRAVVELPGQEVHP